MAACHAFNTDDEFRAFCRDVIAEVVPLPIDLAEVVARSATSFAESFDAQLAAGECLSWARVGLSGLPSPVPYLRKATELCPDSCEAWESLGFALDNVENDATGAEAAFRRAISLGGGEWSFAGLARVLAEAGRREEALRLLSESECPYHSHEEVVLMRTEIKAGSWDPESHG